MAEHCEHGDRCKIWSRAQWLCSECFATRSLGKTVQVTLK